MSVAGTVRRGSGSGGRLQSALCLVPSVHASLKLSGSALMPGVSSPPLLLSLRISKRAAGARYSRYSMARTENERMELVLNGLFYCLLLLRVKFRNKKETIILN